MYMYIKARYNRLLSQECSRVIKTTDEEIHIQYLAIFYNEVIINTTGTGRVLVTAILLCCVECIPDTLHSTFNAI